MDFDFDIYDEFEDTINFSRINFEEIEVDLEQARLTTDDVVEYLEGPWEDLTYSEDADEEDKEYCDEKLEKIATIEEILKYSSFKNLIKI